VTREWTAVLGASSELAGLTVHRLAALHPERRFLLHYRTMSAELEEDIRELGQRAEPIQADLAVAADVDRLRQALLKFCPQPRSLLVAAAPEPQMRRTKEIPREEWHRHLAVQAIAPALLLPPLLANMAKAPSPSQVVFVLSEVIRKTPKGMADYVAGKFAALGLMRALQAEFSGPNLRIHSIAPGMMETRFLRALPELAVEAARQQSPSGQLLSVEECAGKLVRLLEDADALKEDPIFQG
jgi:NAD(P)-dependent dehydrogenase (short-subunit alcohol dehydrogenase family)